MNCKNNKPVFYTRIYAITLVMNLFIMHTTYAQNTGLNFQGVARNPSGVILASQNISLRFSVLNTSASGTAEYIETRIVATNGQGVFSLVIGDGVTSASVQLGSYASINWKILPKFLKVELDPNAGNNFFTMGVTQLQTVPYSNYSQYAASAGSIDATNILGLIPVARGGTGVSDLSTLKSILELENVNNTLDINKPISLATQNSLNNKLAISDSLIVYITPTQLKNSSIDTTYLSNRINLKIEKADLNDRLILKENASNKSTAVDLGGANSSDDLFPTQKAIKTYIDTNSLAIQNILNNKLAIADSLIVYITPTQLKNSSIDTTYLSNRINLKVDNADLNAILGLKENVSNKSSAIDLGGANASDDLYPSQKAVKTYIVANASAGSIADGGITSIKLADGAIIDSKVNFTSPNLGTPMVLIGTNITGTALGLSIGGNAGTATNANYATNAGNASTVTTNANLSGVVTSVGNLTSIADGVINNAMLSGNIAASKLVGNDISNVGTITTGTWSGTLIAVDKGGTGVSSTTANFVFAGPSSQNGAPSFRNLTSSDIPPNLTGYIQSAPSGTQSATINISGSLIADGIKMYAGDNSLLNLSVGVDALESITTGRSNSAIGRDALKYNQNGSYNNAFGIRALYWNVSGINNSAFGSFTLADNYGGNYNSAFGTRALQKNYSSSNNAFGSNSLYANLSGYSNNAFGTNTLSNNTTGINNSAFGDQSMLYNSTGSANSAFGAGAMLNNTFSNYNSAFGAAALYSNTLGSTNSAFGNKSLYATTNGYDNTAMGSQSAYSNTEGIGNTSVGLTSLYNTTIGNGNSAFGKNALNTNVSGNYNLAIGFGADVDAGAYTNAIAIGYNAIVNSSNKIQLGNSNISSVNTSGAITAGSIQNTPIGNLTPQSGNFTTLGTLNNLSVNSLLIGKDPNNIVTNTVMGVSSMFSNSTGANNSAFGYQTLKDNTLGGHNIALGYIALYKNTEGNTNTGVGSYALNGSTIGSGNTAIGANAGTNLRTGSYNTYLGSFTNNTGIGDITNATAIGYNASVNNSNTIQLGNTSVINVNTSGSITAGSIQNTPIGNTTRSSGAFSTLSSATDLTVNGIKIGLGAGNDYSNSVFGYNALASNTTGVGNVAIGQSALNLNTIGTDNIAIGRGGLQLNTNGYNNVSLGGYSLNHNTSGIQNVAMGSHALETNITGSNNVAIGTAALLLNTEGSQNIAMGLSALADNTTGIENIAIGTYGLKLNTTGNDNIAIGAYSLNDNTIGSQNIAIGYSSLPDNTLGSNNIAIGYQALMKTIGASYYNIAIGYSTLYNSLSTIGNTSVGDESMLNNSIGNSNTALGYRAGNSIISGSNNIVIGNSAATSNGTVSNEIVLGNTNNNIIRSQVTSITSLSDKRDKKNIQDLTIGLDFIKSIKPRVFNWDKREWYKNRISDGTKMEDHFTAGFIAQELDSAQNNFNADWLKLVYKSSNERWEATYGNLLPVMVKAIQEQQIIIDDQRQRLEIQRSKLEALEKLVQQIIQAK